MAKPKNDFVVVRRRAFDDLGYQQTQDKNPRKLENAWTRGRSERARFRKPCEADNGIARFKSQGAAERAAQRAADQNEYAEYYSFTVQAVPRETDEALSYGYGWF